MYCICFLSLITVALCQSSSTLVPVKKGYFDITPSTTQVTLTLNNRGGSESINLNDAENIFADDSSEEKDMSSQRVLELSSTDAFQLQPFHSMISEIASNVCLMSLSSDEEHSTDSVDYDSAVNKVGALTGHIVADMGSVSGKNSQTILHLYNAAKSGSFFDTAQLSLPRSGTGSNSQITIQVNLDGYSFKLGNPLATQSQTKESQCAYISKLASTHALNLIKISPLQQNNAGNSSPQLSSSNGPVLSADSKDSLFVNGSADTTKPITQGSSVGNTELSNIQNDTAGSRMTEQSTFSATDTSTGSGIGAAAGTNSINTFGRPGAITTNENSNVNLGTTPNTNGNSNDERVLPALPVLPFIPRLKGYPVDQSQTVEQLNYNPGNFQTNPIQN